MSAICLIDTSILLEILNVPTKSTQSDVITQQLRDKIKAGEILFLPMTSIIETGNHIAQNGDGGQRREIANQFIKMITKALAGEIPFKPLSFLELEKFKIWLPDFEDNAMREIGIGDLSIIKDWEKQKDMHPNSKVYVWSLDQHLKSYESQGASI